MKISKLKKVISFLITLSIITSISLGIVNTSNAATPDLAFGDLDGYEWAADVIAVLKDAGIIEGNNSNCFYPGATLTRAQLAFGFCDTFKLQIDSNAQSSFPEDSEWNSENEWAIPYIEAAKQYFYCQNNNTFNPGANVTREQIVFSIVKILGLDTSNVDTFKAEEKYSKDWVSINDTYKPAVALATTLGFVSGDGNGRFNPTNELNRAELAVLLYRALNFGGGIGGSKFPDVKPGDWYYTEVMNLVNRGIIKGYEDGTFKPENKVENNNLPWWIAKILNKDMSGENYNPMTDTDVTSKLPDDFVNDDSDLTRETTAFAIAKLCNLDTPDDVQSVLASFTDNDAIDADYYDEVAAVVNASYMKGCFDKSGNKIFNPSGSVTRAELAVLTEKALPTTGSNANISGQVFSDVASTDWYYDGVMTLYNSGIVKGYEDGTFRPDVKLKESLAWLIARQLDVIPDDTTNYDPTEDDKVLVYFPNKKFADSREAVIYAIVKIFDIDTSDVNVDRILAGFTDEGDITDVCKPALAYLVSIDALHGNKDGEMNPQDSVTRAEFATIYANTLNGIDTSKMKDYEDTIESVKQEGDE